MTIGMANFIARISAALLFVTLSVSTRACEDLSDWTFEVFDGKGNGTVLENASGDGCDGVYMYANDENPCREPARP